MNRNALTEQRRETVIGLLKGMNIKKSSGEGFDKDDVYECMQQLCDLYEKNIEELENAYESEIEGLRDRYQKYDENNELYVSLIMEAKKSSNEIISQAKTEVETVLVEGKEQVARQEDEIRQMRADMENEKQTITAELNSVREAVEAEKIAMRAEVDAERERMTAMKSKYSQQLNSMESEFEEIKTNILRTAGKIDSLKSKLPTDDEATWNMTNDLDAAPAYIAEPAPVPEVEELFAVPAEPAMDMASFAEPEAQNPVPEVPMVEEAAEFTLEDLVAPAEEISFDDIQVELPEFVEEPVAMPETFDASPIADQSPVEEISFEGLEELFKED